MRYWSPRQLFCFLLLALLLFTPSPVFAPRRPSGKAPLEVLVEGFRAPTGLAVAPDGTLFFTDEKEGSLLERAPDGTLSLLEDRLKQPRGLTRAPDGTLFLLAEWLREHRGEPRPKGLLLKRDPAGPLTVLAAGFQKPQQLLVTPEGTLFLSTREGLRPSPGDAPDEGDEGEDEEADDEEGRRAFPGTVFRVSPAGGLLDSHPGFRHPAGLVLLADGSLLVAADGFKRDGPPLLGSIFQLSPEGRVTVLLPQRFKRPQGLVQDALGALYLAVQGETRRATGDPADGKEDEGRDAAGLLLKVSPEGALTRFAHGFARPWGLALAPQGHLYVSDPKAGRLYRFRAPPPPTLAPFPATTNQPTVPVTGTTEPAAQITVRGGQAAVQTPADAQGAFTLAAPLHPNQPNPLSVYATAGQGEGLTGAPATVTILQDSTPPTLAVLTPGPETRLTGVIPVEIAAEDALSGLATVELLVDGVLGGSQAAPPFSFSLDTTSLPAGPHTLTARAVDQAGNAASVSLSVLISQLRVAITTPADGATLPESLILVQGTLETPEPEVGVTVNGIGAAVQKGRFAALLPVSPVTTHLTAQATTATGATASHTIAITVAPAPEAALQLQVSPAGGVAPLPVGFALSGGPAPTAVALDADGDGTVDLSGPPLEGQTFTYPTPGLYLPTVTVTDAQGRRHTATAVVQVYDRAALDTLLQAKWTSLNDALRAGDIIRAVTVLHTDTRAAYEAQFRRFRPATLANLDRYMTTIQLIEVGPGGAQYEMLRERNGETLSFAVWFQVDGDGIWRLRRF